MLTNIVISVRTSITIMPLRGMLLAFLWLRIARASLPCHEFCQVSLFLVNESNNRAPGKIRGLKTSKLG